MATNVVVATISELVRLKNSKDGNPRYKVHTDKGTWNTKPDAYVGFEVQNPEYGEGQTLRLTIDGKGDIEMVEKHLEG